MPDTRLTKTPTLTPEDIALIRKAAMLCGLEQMTPEDMQEFGIVLYQMRGQTEVMRLAEAMKQMLVIPWRNPTRYDSD